jgi:hypothetical protein
MHFFLRIRSIFYPCEQQGKAVYIAYSQQSIELHLLFHSTTLRQLASGLHFMGKSHTSFNVNFGYFISNHTHLGYYLDQYIDNIYKKTKEFERVMT